MTPLMRLGSERFIVQEDLNDLLPEDASGNVGEKLQHYWEKEMQYKRGFVSFPLTASLST